METKEISDLPLGTKDEKIIYKCPECKGKLGNKGTMGGRRDKCPFCGHMHDVPLSKSQKRELRRQRSEIKKEEKRQKAEARREEKERLALEKEKLDAVRADMAEQQHEESHPEELSVTHSPAKPPPLEQPLGSPPPLPAANGGSSKRIVWISLVMAGAVLLIAGVGTAALFLLRGPSLESFDGFVRVAKQIRMGIGEGITFSDFSEKHSELRDAYALINWTETPPVLGEKATVAFQKSKELRETWRKSILDDRYGLLKASVQTQLNGTAWAFDDFLREYARLKGD